MHTRCLWTKGVVHAVCQEGLREPKTLMRDSEGCRDAGWAAGGEHFGIVISQWREYGDGVVLKCSPSRRVQAGCFERNQYDLAEETAQRETQNTHFHDQLFDKHVPFEYTWFYLPTSARQNE